MSEECPEDKTEKSPPGGGSHLPAPRHDSAKSPGDRRPDPRITAAASADGDLSAQPPIRISTRLPDGPKVEKRVSAKPRPEPAPPVRMPAPAAPPAPPEPAEASPRKRAGGMARILDESQRLQIAAGIAPQQGIARIGSTGRIVFRCPACMESQQADESAAATEFTCGQCGAELVLPALESGAKIRLIRTKVGRDDPAALPALHLPDERAEDGPSGKATFQPVEELLPEGEEGTVSWGLEKREAPAVRPRRARRWVWAAGLVFLLAAGFLIRHAMLSSGRTAQAGGEGESARISLAPPAAGEKLAWDSLSPTQRFLLADATIRSYLSAPDLPAKAALTRQGAAHLPRMEAFYQRTGGYESETSAHGPVSEASFHERRTVDGRDYQLMHVRFQRGAIGMYALLCGDRGYEVDWEYAVGYGEIPFLSLMENKPVVPVLLRAYLTEGRYFTDGFDEQHFRHFQMFDPTRELSVPVFVRRDGPAESALRQAWNDAVLESIGTSTGEGYAELDFVVRVRFENTGGRSGFLIDEVLTRGWILPDVPQ